MFSYAILSAQYTTDSLIFGTRWGAGAVGTTLTYSFPGLNGAWVDYTNPGEPYVGFTPFNANEQQAVRDILQAWSSVANLGFIEVADSADSNGTLRIAYTSYLMDAHQMGYTYLPNDLASGGDIWLNAGLQNSIFQTLAPSTLGGFTILHELGHALGLKHSAEASAYSSATLGSLEDTIFNTVMSFNAWPGVPLTLAGNIDRLPGTPMSYDIDALQYLYGVNTTTHNGDDHYVFTDNGKYLQTIYDTGGNDTIELTGTQGGEIDLRPGEWSRLGIPVQINGGAIQNPDTVRIYRTTLVENAIGSDGTDILIGNDAANTLQGNAGDDTLQSNAGDDTLIGGAGCDTFTGGTGSDCFVLATVAQDIITDFSIADGDKIDLGQVISFFTGYTIGCDLFANGYLSLSQLGNDTHITYDTDGTATTDTAHNLVTFQNFTANSLNNATFIHGWAAGGVMPAMLNATVKGFALDATGEVFTGTAPGINFIATGGNGVDIVYVKAGATVDASKLNSGEDKIYFTGNWADYTKVATTSKITFTNGTTGETVIVAAATGASNDRLVFADGYVLSNDAKTALLTDAAAPLSAIPGFSTAEGTGAIVTGTTATDTLNGAAAGDVIYGNGGADLINGGAGADTIVITDTGTTAASSATIRLTSIADGTDTIIGFSAAPVANGGDVLDFSAIANLADTVATGQTLTTDFVAANVFIFDGTPVAIADAAAAIAADVSVVATNGYIVIADASNGNAVTVYHSTDLTANGTETALAILSGVNITNLVSVNLLA